jgi:hypothetical protein
MKGSHARITNPQNFAQVGISRGVFKATLRSYCYQFQIGSHMNELVFIEIQLFSYPPGAIAFYTNKKILLNAYIYPVSPLHQTFLPEICDSSNPRARCHKSYSRA